MVDFVRQFTELSKHSQFLTGNRQPQRVFWRLFGQQWRHLLCIKLLVVAAKKFVYNLLQVKYITYIQLQTIQPHDNCVIDLMHLSNKKNAQFTQTYTTHNNSTKC